MTLYGFPLPVLTNEIQNHPDFAMQVNGIAFFFSEDTAAIFGCGSEIIKWEPA